MKFDSVVKGVGKVPYMSIFQGHMVYHFILDNDVTQILELGTGYGAGSCYLAAALQQKGVGSLVTIDKMARLQKQPNVLDLLRENRLEEFVQLISANTTYNWELMKLIDSSTADGVCEPIFDFCYIDGAHNFEIDTAAFFLADKLLKPGGKILFDDLNWTYEKSPSLRNSSIVRKMSDHEKTTPHIKKLVDLIVTIHPNYSDFETIGDWFLATKHDPLGMKKKVTLNSYAPNNAELDRLKNLSPVREFNRQNKSTFSKRFDRLLENLRRIID